MGQSFSIFSHVTKPVRETNSEPGLPVVWHPEFAFYWTKPGPSCSKAD